MKTHRAIAESLRSLSTDVVFGLLGDGNLLLVADLTEFLGWRYVSANREDGAVVMADAYARATGNLGVATVTHGPGLTNTITALHEAAKARTPMLVLVGDVAAGDRLHNQRIDQRATVLPTGAGFVQLRGPQHASEDVALAIRQAVLERRPYVVNLPVDLQMQEANDDIVAWPLPSRQALAPDPEAVSEALGVIASSRRPIVLAGRGAVEAGARAALLRLAEVLNAPVATTLKARGYFAGERFNLGVCGTVSTPTAVEAIGKSDCIIAFGAGLNRYTLSMGAFANGRALVQIDTDAQALGRHFPVTSMVVGDAAITATTMADLLKEWTGDLGERPAGLRSDDLADRLASQRPEDEFTDRSGHGTIDVRTACIWLDRAAPADRTLVVDVGGFMGVPLRYLSVPDPFADVLPANLGSVGLSMAASVGAGIGRPDRPVVAVTGDGGFMMGGLTELDTAVRHGIDLVVMVLNDGSYSIEYRNLQGFGRDPELSLMSWPDLAPVAKALGARGVTVRDLADFDAAAQAIRDRDRPLLIDVRVDPSLSPDA